jgi:limonene-1,2-epoxide hydrolase
MSNLKRAQEFCDLWATMDLDKIMGFLTPDCFYHNIPMEPLVGHAAIRPFFEPMVAGCQSMEYVVHAIAENAHGWVLTERTDIMMMSGKKVAVRVMGVFEFKDGLISAWRDYWDLAQFQSQMA